MDLKLISHNAMKTYLSYLPAAVMPETDAHGRAFIVKDGRRYLVPACAAEMDKPCEYWHFHDHLRLAIPGSFDERIAKSGMPFTHYAGPDDYESGSCIYTIDAESRAVAVFVAAVCGLRVFGWDIRNSDGRDCTGQTFAGDATIFRMERLSREPRQHFYRYGFHVSWCRDI